MVCDKRLWSTVVQKCRTESVKHQEFAETGSELSPTRIPSELRLFHLSPSNLPTKLCSCNARVLCGLFCWKMVWHQLTCAWHQKHFQPERPEKCFRRIGREPNRTWNCWRSVASNEVTQDAVGEFWQLETHHDEDVHDPRSRCCVQISWSQVQMWVAAWIPKWVFVLYSGSR